MHYAGFVLTGMVSA